MQSAEGYALERVNSARGRRPALRPPTRNTERLPRSPAVASTSRHGGGLSRAGSKLFLDEKARGLLPFLQLDWRPREAQP